MSRMPVGYEAMQRAHPMSLRFRGLILVAEKDPNAFA